MAEQRLLKRITANPDIFSGKPIIRGMRISVEMVLSLLAQGAPVQELLDDFPDLEEDDIKACLAYAHAVIAHDSLDSLGVGAH
ncbi:MAG: DUF433 domain-containing protein [Desulfobacterales bacterium]|jgi:uncharacterized protein (DUF433 family)|nr:DUF433 domain-containing protein [Desulfobacterales bacterium]MBU0989871.1 DUF433 domain-containing protein [Pseudomonadota bacterium]